MQGLSDPKKLLTELQELAAQLCGEVMIFQLAQHTEVYKVPYILRHIETLVIKSKLSYHVY